MARLFVAVPLPVAVLEQLDVLPRPAEQGVRWTRREHWHVTLRFLGECALDDAVVALDSLEAPTAHAELGPQVSRLGRHVVCVPVSGLDELAESVAAATAHLGEPPDPRPFRGHVTLARLKHRAACGLAGTPITASFVAGRIELVESVLTPSGPVHETRLEVALRHADDLAE